MTQQECGDFLDEMIALYPSMMRPGVDQKMLLGLWSELLVDQEYKKAHNALMRYFREDKKGYVPTYGQLFPNAKVYMTEEEEQEIMRNLVY